MKNKLAADTGKGDAQPSRNSGVACVAAILVEQEVGRAVAGDMDSVRWPRRNNEISAMAVAQAELLGP